ncbi:MAG: hypothetical protein H6573_36230 [Lewinellaceae bacterium]|nr:hypothetical protein [Lewinellaceae bacterium]
MDAEQLLNDLKIEINAQLDQCQDDGKGTFTPKICSFIRTEEGRKKIVQLIINYVAEEGMTIAESINEIERDYNDNLIES